MGFVGPERKIIDQLSVDLDQRGNLSTPNNEYNTSIPNLYAAGGELITFSLVRTLLFFIKGYSISLVRT